VEGIEDILDELGALFHGAAPTLRSWGEKGDSVGDLTEEERRVLSLLTEEEPLDADTLARRSAMPPGSVSAALLTLEMKGRVRLLPGRVIERLTR
jgi:predicted Rossmann fold nucleotide-binding protein DprA/Smf involved in DNA uptake